MGKRLPEEVKTEADVLKYARVYLKSHAWSVIRIQQGLGCHPGISDLIAIKNGLVVFLEIKSPRWKPTKNPDAKSKTEQAQDKFEAEMLSQGVTYVRVQSAEQVEEIGGMA